MTLPYPLTEPFDTGLPFNNRFATLGTDFFEHQPPTPLPAPYLVGHSAKVANELGMHSDWAQSDDWLQVFSGNRTINGSTPLASVPPKVSVPPLTVVTPE